MVFALVAAVLGAWPGGAEEVPPNVVLILADDLGWGDVGFNGRREWSTPRLDGLAGEGVRLDRFYAGAVVCAPSRGVLMTGRYTIHNGVSRNDQDLPRGEVTLAEALTARGYATALFGKWHHGAPRAGEADYVHPMDQGFGAFFGFTDARHAWEKYPKELWDGRERVPVTGYADDLFADRAVAFVGANRERPFFLYVPFTATHFHVEAPEEEVARQRGAFPGDDEASATRRRYAAMVARLDRNVGRILDAIDGAGLRERTIVVFASDHGATFEGGGKGASALVDSNAPFRGQKRTLWEGGIRVPACVRWPGRIPAGTSSAEPMHAADLLPTLVGAAGGPAHEGPALDGVDLMPAWRGSGRVPDRVLFWEWRSEGAEMLAAMRGDLKLTINRGGKPELYDVAADPAERIDRSALHPDAVKALRGELEGWLATERRGE
jgi:arylsulfatase A-like enzyme